MKPFGIIYLITNIQNNKKYIGQTIQTLMDRKKQHLWDMENPRRKHFVLYRAIHKHGIHNFKWQILGECFSKEELDIAEKECIEFFQSNNKIYGYNNTNGGTGGPIRKGMKSSEETKRRISESTKGRPVTSEARIKISNTLKGRKLPEETKKKMSESRMGRKAWNKGKKLSDEHRKKMSESRKGKQTTLGKHWKWSKNKNIGGMR